MLSEREQRALDEIEMRLVIEDPRFCRRMNQRSARGHLRRSARIRLRALLVYLGLFLIFLAAGIGFAVGGWIPGVVLVSCGVAIVGACALAYWHRRRRHRPGCL